MKSIVSGIVISLLLLIFAAIVESSKVIAQPQPQRVSDVRDAKLILCVWREVPGNNRVRNNDGVLFAVWDDGVVLYSSTWEYQSHEKDRKYFTARLVEPVDNFIKRCKEEKELFTNKQVLYQVPGSSSVYIGLDDAARSKFVATAWDEVIHRNYGISTASIDVARAYVKSWYSFRLTLSTLAIEHVSSIERSSGDNFRGIPLWDNQMYRWRLERSK